MRQKVEKAIVKSMALRLNGSFEKSREDFSSSVDHLVTFSRVLEDGETTIKIVLRFIRPYQLTLGTRMVVVHKKVNALLIENASNTEFPSVPIIEKGMDDFFAGGMSKEIFYLEQGGTGLEGIDVEKAVDRIYSRYFEYVLTTLEPTIDSLEKLNGLINNDKNLQGGSVTPSIYSTLRQNQILAGLALAILVKPDTYSEIMSTYRKFLSTYIKPGEDKKVDLARVLIAKYAPA